MANIIKTNQIFPLLIRQAINTSITQTNQLITLMSCHQINHLEFEILTPHSIKQKKVQHIIIKYIYIYTYTQYTIIKYIYTYNTLKINKLIKKINKLIYITH